MIKKNLIGELEFSPVQLFLDKYGDTVKVGLLIISVICAGLLE